MIKYEQNYNYQDKNNHCVTYVTSRRYLLLVLKERKFINMHEGLISQTSGVIQKILILIEQLHHPCLYFIVTKFQTINNAFETTDSSNQSSISLYIYICIYTLDTFFHTQSCRYVKALEIESILTEAKVRERNSNIIKPFLKHEGNSEFKIFGSNVRDFGMTENISVFYKRALGVELQGLILTRLQTRFMLHIYN